MRITKRQLKRIIREEVSRYNDDRVEHDPERDTLMDALEEKYNLQLRTTEEFGSSPGGVWIAAELSDAKTSDGLPLFDYYLDMDPYEFGVHPEFSSFVSQYGFFPEWNDPGTLMLWRM